MEVLEPILKPQITCDALTMLLHTGKYLDASESPFEDELDVAYREKNKRIKQLVSTVKTRFAGLVTKDYAGAHLYDYHLQLKGGIDLQISPKFHIRQKIDDAGYVEVFGTEQDVSNGYMFEYFQPDYAVRLEWNPSKNDIFSASDVFKYFADKFETPFDKLLKISRLDVAIDYPDALNPALFLCDHARKNFHCGGSNGLESVYFNARKSKSMFRIYNKKLELKQKQQIDYSGEHLWRIELELKNAFNIGENVQSFIEYFDKLHYFGNGKKTDSWELDLILFKGMHYGLYNVLKELPKNTSDRYRQRLFELEYCPVASPSEMFAKNFPGIWGRLYQDIKTSFGRESDANMYVRNDLNFGEIHV